MTKELSGGWNFRDVADSTAGAVRPGRLFRAGELTKLDDTGVSQLAELGVTDVADLRSGREVERHGSDLVPDGVKVHLLPFVDAVAAVDGADGGDAPHEQAFKRLMTEKPDDESTLQAAKRYMTEAYTTFAKAPGAARALHRTATLIADGASVLTHCFAGKDRTGFSVAVILEVAGVDRDTIMNDYLHSNAAAPQLREQILAMIRKRFDGEIPADAAELTQTRLSDDVLGVRPEYLDTALRIVEADYGSLRGYLQFAGVTEDQLSRLRTELRG